MIQHDEQGRSREDMVEALSRGEAVTKTRKFTSKDCSFAQVVHCDKIPQVHDKD